MKSIIATLFLAAAAFAQPSYYLGLGPSLHAEAPHAAFNVTTGICTVTVNDCVLVNYAARFDFPGIKSSVVYSTSLSERHVLGSVGVGSKDKDGSQATVSLFTLANAGASVSTSAVGFSGAGGGGLTYHPKKMPDLGISVAAQADYSPVNPGWRPNIFWQVGYTFHTGAK